MIEKVLILVLGGGNLLLFVQFLIERHDKQKKEGKEDIFGKINTELSNLTDELKKLKKDGLRTQLLMLLLIKPEEETEILTLAEHYFKKPPAGLGGNWYMTNLFKNWLEENKVGKPEWFETE